MTTLHTYDLVPYPDFVHPRTNPDNIAAMVRLFGFNAVSLYDETSRVLELGCGQAGNLISLASLYPESQFTGIDMSRGHIAAGQAIIDQLGLDNITLLVGDLSEFSRSLNSSEEENVFDFILVHGVYSWVPDDVRRHVLRICHDCLSPRGVTFISYNTLPGWHAKGLVREVLRHHVLTTLKSPMEPMAMIGEAKRFLADVAESVPESSGYGKLLREEFRSLNASNEAYLFHEQFEAINEARYFHQFIDETTAAGLQYVCEASMSYVPSQSTAMQQRMRSLPRLAREQYLDYLCNRTFRQSLLCRTDAVDLISDSPGAAAMEPLWLSTEVTCNETDHELQIVNPDGASATLASTVTKAAVQRLATIQYAAESFRDLCGEVIDKSQSLEQQMIDRDLLRAELIQLAHFGMVRFNTGPLPLTRKVRKKPKCSALARLQATTSEFATSQRHVAVRLDEATRHIITLCDGQTDHAGITEGMMSFVTREGVTLQHEGASITDPEVLRKVVAEKILPNLQNLATMGFLMR